MKDYEKPQDEAPLAPARKAKAKDAAAPKNVGGRPRKDVTKTPEFQAAVTAGVAEAEARIVAQITASLAAARGTDPVAAPASSDQSMIQQLTASIMAMVNIGKPDKPLTPEEAQSRSDGQKRLIELLVPVQAMDYDAPGAPEAPFYRVVSKAYLTDFVVEPFEVDPVTKAMVPKTIHWTGFPNESLEPINESAKEIHTAYMQSIGGFSEFAPDSAISNVTPDGRPMGVTPGGIVVRGLNVSARRTVGGIAPGSTTDVMGIRNQNDPRAKSIRVLGTVADPAIAGEGPKFAGNLRA